MPPPTIFLQIAADHAAGVDLHTDETLDPSFDGLSDLAAVVTATGFAGPVTASHCVSLGMQPPERQQAVAEAVAAAGIAVIALPATNLFLQGREHQHGMPRGLTAVRALLAAGVVVAAGADNVQDPFNPLGRACPFETAALMVWTTHLSPADAWSSVTDRAALAVGRTPATIAAGVAGRPHRRAGGLAPRSDRHGRAAPHRLAPRPPPLLIRVFAAVRGFPAGRPRSRPSVAGNTRIRRRRRRGSTGSGGGRWRRR